MAILDTFQKKTGPSFKHKWCLGKILIHTSRKTYPVCIFLRENSPSPSGRGGKPPTEERINWWKMIFFKKHFWWNFYKLLDGKNVFLCCRNLCAKIAPSRKKSQKWPFFTFFMQITEEHQNPCKMKISTKNVFFAGSFLSSLPAKMFFLYCRNFSTKLLMFKNLKKNTKIVVFECKNSFVQIFRIFESW